MFKKYRVVVSVINLSDGESDEVIRKDTFKEAKDLFYDKLSQLGGNPQTKAVSVIILDTNGNVIKSDKIDNSIYSTE